MENKLYDKNSITLDGRLDEPVWASVPEQTGFHLLKSQDAALAPVQTSFKIIPCQDRIVIGVKCEEPDMEYVTKTNPFNPIWNADVVEIFMSPACNYFDFYQFVVSFEGQTTANFYSEGGNIKPDPFAPEWNAAVYRGEDFWSVEVEIPLTAFYMTPNDLWSDSWLVNVCRSRTYMDISTHRMMSTSWSQLDGGYKDSKNFRELGGFPKRPARDDLRISSAMVDIADETEAGFCGTLAVMTVNPEDGEFEFTSDCTEPITVSLKTGTNEFTVPCCFAERGRHSLALQLKRLPDGEVFKRRYPVRVTYESIKLSFTSPEYRCNFYPGQDHSKVVGKVIANKPVTLTLEGPGIETQTITPNADGSFCFATPNFEVGEAFLTASTEDRELVQKIRRLAPSKHMMSWISGGNIIINGETILPRRMSAVGWHGGEAFKRKYEADDLHETRDVVKIGNFQPGRLMKGSEAGGEANRHAKPSDEMFRLVDEVLEKCKDKEFAFYFICDEPECRSVSEIYLKYIYDYVTDKDPYHIVRVSTRNANEFVDVADWFETHPYINPYTREDGKRIYAREINTVGNFLDPILKLNRPDKCMGFLGTCFAAMKSHPEPYPTFEEFICHIWAGLVRGGKSLCLYAYHDMNDRPTMYEGTRYIFSSVERLEKLLLLSKRTVLIKNQKLEGVLYECEGEKLFVLVNMTNKPQRVTLDGISGIWHEFRHNRLITGNTFDLKPLEVVIGTSEVKDEELPTYQEVKALVDKLEYERTHTGSLLFERLADLKLTASSSTGGAIKLFDGIKDNYAFEMKGDAPKFLEMDLTKVAPTFSKVVVGGFQIDDMQIKVRNNGELSVPAIKEKTTEEFSTTFILAEPISPDALRLEFGERRVELYEIEVF